MLICVGRLSVRTLTPDLYLNRRNPRQRTIIPEYYIFGGFTVFGGWARPASQIAAPSSAKQYAENLS